MPNSAAATGYHLEHSVIVLDWSGTILSWSDEAEHRYGWSGSEAVGRNVDDLLKSRHALPAALVARELRRSESWTGYVDRAIKDGRDIHLSLVCISSQLDGDECIIELSRERHGRGRMAMTSRPAPSFGRYGMIRSACETNLAELMSVIAHEATQPLASLSTSAHAIRRWIDRSEPDLGEVLLLADQLAEDAHRVNSTIAAARRSASRTKASFEPLSMVDVVLDALEILRHELTDSEVSVALDLPTRLPRFRGRPADMQQVIVHLVSSAVETVAELTERAVRVTGSSIGGCVRLTVSTSGSRLPTGPADTLADDAQAPDTVDPDLGYVVCRSILERHGGSIVLLDGKSGRSCHITLPALHDEASSSQA